MPTSLTWCKEHERVLSKYLLAGLTDDEKGVKIGEFLIGRYITLDTPLDVAKTMGLPVREGAWEDV